MEYWYSFSVAPILLLQYFPIVLSPRTRSFFLEKNRSVDFRDSLEMGNVLRPTKKLDFSLMESPYHKLFCQYFSAKWLPFPFIRFYYIFYFFPDVVAWLWFQGLARAMYTPSWPHRCKKHQNQQFLVSFVSSCSVKCNSNFRWIVLMC